MIESEASSLSQTEQLEEISNLLQGAPTLEEGEEAETPEPEQAEESEQAEVEAAEPAEASDEEEIPEGEGEALPKTLTDLADKIGMSPEELYALEISMPDGRDSVTLGQLKEAATDLRRDVEQIERRKLEIAQAEEQAKAALQAAVAVPPAVRQAQAQMDRVVQEAQQIDWDAFEKKDPAKAALAHQKVNRAMQAAQMNLQQVSQQAQQMQLAYQRQKVNEEKAKLLQLIPEWREGDTAAKDVQQVVDVMTSRYGFHPQEVLQTADSRVILALRDLARLLSTEKQADVASKRVSRAPRHLRPVRAQRNSSKEQERLVQRAKETRNPEDQRAAVANLLSSKGIL